LLHSLVVVPVPGLALVLLVPAQGWELELERLRARAQQDLRETRCWRTVQQRRRSQPLLDRVRSGAVKRLEGRADSLRLVRLAPICFSLGSSRAHSFRTYSDC